MISALNTRGLILSIWSLAVFGQGPITDQLVVALPNTTWVGSKSLPAGTYTIRQLPTASSPRLLEFSSDNGTKLETAITTIAASDNNTRHDTSVVLEQRAGRYHLTHIWIEGKTYGYELPIDSSRQEASNRTAETLTLTANFTPAPVTVAAAQPPQRAASAPVESSPASQPAAEQAPPPAQVAQAQPPPPPAQTPAADPVPRENTQLAAQTPAMPRTATHWPEMTLGGILLILFGVATLRRQASNA